MPVGVGGERVGAPGGGLDVEVDHTLPIRRDHFDGDGAARGTARMEAFADAVFAIAFTLPVLEIKMPHPGPEFGADLVRLWPSYLGYIIASTVIGLYWALHHFAGAIYRTTGHWLNLATVLFLAAIGFVAFPARGFAENIADPVTREPAARYLAVALAFTAVTWLIKWAVARRTGHVDARLDLDYVRGLDRKYAVSTALMVAAAGLSFVNWPGGLALSAVVTLYYFLPMATPVYRTEAPAVEGEEMTVAPSG